MTMWLIPMLLLGGLAVVQVTRVLAHGRLDPLDREAMWLIRDHRVQQLAARLRRAPVVVRCLHATGLTNRIVLDVGGEEIDARCYHTPTRSIEVVTALFYRPSVGWIIEVDGPNGPSQLSAWLLEVHPVRAGRAQGGGR